MKKILLLAASIIVLVLGLTALDAYRLYSDKKTIRQFYPDVKESTLSRKEVARRMTWVNWKVETEYEFQKSHTENGVLHLKPHQLPPPYIQKRVSMRARLDLLYRVTRGAQFMARSLIPPAWAACDANTITMLHGNGTDASTTITDDAPTPSTFTANGNAQIDTAQSKFGGASILFDGTDDYLESAAASTWAPGTAAYTWDFQARFNSLTGDRAYLDVNNGNGGGYTLETQSGGTALAWTDTGSGRKTESWSPSTATWYHIAVVQSGGGSGTLRFFIDGTEIGSATATNNNLSDTTHVFRIGTMNTGIRDIDAWIDEFRFSNTARWSANFTAPSSEYCASAASRSGGMDTMGCC